MSMQVVISLCKRKETAALLKPPFSFGRDYCLLNDGFFSFAIVRQIIILYLFPQFPIKLFPAIPIKFMLSSNVIVSE